MKGECITPMYNTQLALSQTRKGKCQGDAPFPTVNQYPGPVKRGKPTEKLLITLPTLEQETSVVPAETNSVLGAKKRGLDLRETQLYI